MQLPDRGKRAELIQGKLIEMPGLNVSHGLITSRLFRALDNYLEAKPIGEVLTNLAFELNPKTVPLPNLAFVQAARMVGLDLFKAFPGAPDLAIEVMSPTDKLMPNWMARMLYPASS